MKKFSVIKKYIIYTIIFLIFQSMNKEYIKLYISKF